MNKSLFNKLKEEKEAKIAFIISLVYVSIGTYDLLLSEMKISKFLDSISDGLENILIVPANFIGGMFWWLASQFIYDTKLWGWLGQILNLIVIWFILYITLKIINTIKNMIFPKKLI